MRLFSSSAKKPTCPVMATTHRSLVGTPCWPAHAGTNQLAAPELPSVRNLATPSCANSRNRVPRELCVTDIGRKLTRMSRPNSRSSQGTRTENQLERAPFSVPNRPDLDTTNVGAAFGPKTFSGGRRRFNVPEYSTHERVSKSASVTPLLGRRRPSWVSVVTAQQWPVRRRRLPERLVFSAWIRPFV